MSDGPSENLRDEDLRNTVESASDASTLPSSVRLVVSSGADHGRELAMTRGVYRIGASADSNLVLRDRAVSRQHLELRVSDQAVEAVDLASRNGSYYQGVRFSALRLGLGAEIVLGGTRLRLAGPAGAEPPLSDRDHLGELRGASVAMRRVYALIERAARTDVTVLIQGETGTGKELCAAAIHGASPRARGPLVVCDLGGMARSVIESELFGHKRGAFTGAHSDHKGAFESARSGTLFLDEIGELELEMQPRLLRAIESRSIKPVGANEYRQVDARFVSATHRDLYEEARKKRFREDLYHRISVVTIELPPLRTRREDIPMLVRHFLGKHAVEIPSETMALISAYDWPGNVRQLRNVIERVVSLLAPGEQLTPMLLGLREERAGVMAEPGEARFREAREQMVGTWEREYLSKLLERTGGNVTEAARMSGMGRVTIHRMIRKYGLGRSARD